MPTQKRHKDYKPFINKDTIGRSAKRLSDSSAMGWRAIKEMDTDRLATAMNECRMAHQILIPNMFEINLSVPDAMGYKFVGAGGGGYLMAVSDKPVPNGIKFKIVQSENYLERR
ncbi:MAG: hypothetical protein FWC51_04865 [Proteobacteria bacterium]|nr:hypothetical protein [Pseudomonadota bacterium]